MNEIDAWLACDEDGDQNYFFCEPAWNVNMFLANGTPYWPTHGHDIQPGQCRPVKLRVEVVKDGS